MTLPLNKFICVTGVSGSGKSTLVNEVLYKALAQKVSRARTKPGLHDGIEGIEHISKIIEIDQSPIGRTPRSNPATYTGVFDQIRALYSETNEAKARGYKPGRFSFNVKGGRCEACKGDGIVKIEMHFLPDVYVPCEVCHGARYNRETLQVKFKGKSIADVLDMQVEEALDFFANIPRIQRKLQTIFDVGLGYIRLGQPATTLSGGEAQRVKLATELSRRSNGGTLYILTSPPPAAYRRCLPPAPGPHPPGGRRLHRGGHRAQFGCDQDGGLYHRPGPRGRRPGWSGNRHRHPEEVAKNPSPTPASSWPRCWQEIENTLLNLFRRVFF